MTGAMIAKIATEHAGLQARVVPQGGPPVTLPALDRGEIEFSIAESMTTALAYNGKVMFNQPLSGVRVAAALFPLRVGMFVRADSGIRSIAELKGKRVAAEFPIQRNNHLMTEAALATAGLTIADIKPWPVPDGVRGVDDFIGGKVDATLFSLGSGKTQQAAVSVGGIRFL
jgi:TRAP transporter TAXI family solute receptor